MMSMSEPSRTPEGEAVTDLILDVFRLNGRLLAAGDRLVAGLGLTSARWQVMGAIAMADHPRPVAWIARDMGLNRQGVQRVVNELEKERIVEFEPNPHHRRAQLVVLTDRGKAAYDAAGRLQHQWVNSLADGVSVQDTLVARRVLAALRKRLETEVGNVTEVHD
jgi:DNA-binding MarR family transcriptional regulator